MLDLVAVAAWMCFGTYTGWFLFSAKDYAPISPEDMFILWKIHKKESLCNSTKIEKLLYKDRVVGFKCGCGYKYLSKRPVTQEDLRTRAAWK